MAVSKYILDQAAKHTAIEVGRSKYIYYKVLSGNSKKEHHPKAAFSCDCEYMGSEGIAKGRLCSHIVAMLKDIIKEEEKHGNKNTQS